MGSLKIGHHQGRVDLKLQRATAIPCWGWISLYLGGRKVSCGCKHGIGVENEQGIKIFILLSDDNNDEKVAWRLEVVYFTCWNYLSDSSWQQTLSKWSNTGFWSGKFENKWKVRESVRKRLNTQVVVNALLLKLSYGFLIRIWVKYPRNTPHHCSIHRGNPNSRYTSLRTNNNCIFFSIDQPLSAA